MKRAAGRVRAYGGTRLRIRRKEERGSEVAEWMEDFAVQHPEPGEDRRG